MATKGGNQLDTVVGGPIEPHNDTIQIADYDPTWPELYAVQEAAIRAALGPIVAGIWHMGSTSVPGLAAKPILDITLAVAHPADEAAYVPPLASAGYWLRRREPDWYEHRVLKHDDPVVNLHVYPAGCPEIDRVLTVRDWLRANAEDHALYEATKRRLAAQVWDHVQSYADAKSEVVEAIIARALQGRV